MIVKCFKSKLLVTFGLFLITSIAHSDTLAKHSNNVSSITKSVWGEVDGKKVYLYELKNANQMRVKITNWGGYIQSIIVPDKKGVFDDVLLGYDSWPQYYNDCCYSGPIVGRFGNRIAEGRFSIDGEKYQLVTNNGGQNNDKHHLHGGLKGLHKRLWDAEIKDGKLLLSYLSKDGEEGYPGNLNITVIFSLNDNNEFKIEYIAKTDKKTPVNLTWHPYINLTGTAESIEDHELWINASNVTEVDSDLIPTGKFLSVSGTPFDFKTFNRVGKNIRKDNAQLRYGGGVDTKYGGYDHNWVLDDYDGSLKHQLSLYEPKSGRLLEIFTTEPGMQFYSGNFMDGSYKGKGKVINHRSGMALEPQNFPDAPNHANFHNSILSPSGIYETVSMYKFSLDRPKQ
jgi:aldose 1-epimerase